MLLEATYTSSAAEDAWVWTCTELLIPDPFHSTLGAVCGGGGEVLGSQSSGKPEEKVE